jgi:hypothetical protein
MAQNCSEVHSAVDNFFMRTDNNIGAQPFRKGIFAQRASEKDAVMAITIEKSDSMLARKVKISGPAIDKLNRRKENNDRPKMTGKTLDKNLKSVTGTLFRDLKKFVSSK